MLMTAQPIYDAVKSVQGENSHIVFASPSGQTLSVEKAKELATKQHLIFICGHYEGIDQRVLDLLQPEEISIGDYVLTGGELPTMVIVDALSRFIDGVITKESLDEESFSAGNLEYPQYTRPQIFEGLAVPDVLVSGNHQEIAKWRKAQSEEKTRTIRPDLMK
jgi:tRNA (guanine37-N1)-methyltransferase